jgi:hypothetical protein
LTIVTELAAISGMERERLSGAERKRGMILCLMICGITWEICAVCYNWKKGKDNQNGHSLVTEFG